MFPGLPVCLQLEHLEKQEEEEMSALTHLLLLLYILPISSSAFFRATLMF